MKYLTQSGRDAVRRRANSGYQVVFFYKTVYICLSTMDITEKLISLVKPNRCLYDCREKDNKNPLKKDILWEKIAKQLNQSSDIIRTKWKNLKDGYAKYKKSIKGTRGHKRAYVNWVWGPYLTFLDGTVQARRTTSNFVITSECVNNAEVSLATQSLSNVDIDTKVLSTNNAEDTGINIVDANTSNNSLSEKSQPLPVSPLIPTTRAHRKRLASEQDNALDKLLGYLSNKKKKDSVDLLFASYAKSLKQMKPMTQACVKIKLAQIFADAELQDMQLENQNVPVSVLSPTYSEMSTSDNDCKYPNLNIVHQD